MIRRRTLLLFAILAFVVFALNTTPVTAQVATQTAPATVDPSARATQTEVGPAIPDDSAVNKMLEAYTPKVRGLSEVIGKLRGDLRKGGVGAGSLGNFVTNGMKKVAERKLNKSITAAITNSGGLRKNVITEGDLRLQDMFELLPFENAMVAFDLTGAQVVELLRGVTNRRDAQAGAKIKYKLNEQKRPEFESARLIVGGREVQIVPSKIYTVITTDYLLRVTGGDYAPVLSRAQNIRALDITMRDAVTQYVKAETAAGREIKSSLDGRFVFSGPEGTAPEELR